MDSGTWHGTFSAPSYLSAGNSFGMGQAADLNRDGKPDLVLRERNSSALWTLYNQGEGRFTEGPKAMYTAGLTLRALKIADLNRDGRQDLVVLTSNTVQVILARDVGFEAARSLAAPTDSRYLLLGRMNADLSLDAVVRHAGGVSVLAGDGAGGLAPLSSAAAAAGLESFDFALDDWDRDGRIDVAVAAGTGLHLLLNR